jgi:hypothetical protein
LGRGSEDKEGVGGEVGVGHAVEVHASCVTTLRMMTTRERAVEAFSAGLRCSDLVEELGRTRPKMVSELIEIASRFADGEDAYNNKRAHSPEVDRANRQRCRSRNEDGHIRCNQVAAGNEMGDSEGNKSREYQDKISQR